MDAIVTAGGVPKQGDPLYAHTQGKSKAMLDVAGKPMVQWVLDALCDSDAIENIVIIGLSEDNGLVCSKPVHYLDSQGTMLDNIFAGAQKLLELGSKAEKTLVVSSDIPAITPEIIDWITAEALGSDHQIFYTVVKREAMENRFPNSRRSYIKFKDMEICGGDLNAFDISMVTTETGIWQDLIAARKNIFKQAALIGYSTLILLLLRRLTLQGAVKRASKRLDVNARVLVSPYSEVAMDVDKPYQLEVLSNDLKDRMG